MRSWRLCSPSAMSSAEGRLMHWRGVVRKEFVFLPGRQTCPCCLGLLALFGGQVVPPRSVQLGGCARWFLFFVLHADSLFSYCRPP